MATTMRRKYNNTKVTLCGHRFDSRLESERFLELKAMEATGLIRNLCLQVPFILAVNDQPICKYVADFAYIRYDGRAVVEDAKGVRTPVYLLKKKLMAAIHGIDVQEYTGRARRGK